MVAGERFDPSVLPPRPALIPDEMRVLVADHGGADWQTRVPPEGVGMLMAAIIRWLSHPRMGCVVRVETREQPVGWTLHVDVPGPPARDDVSLA